ncbi:hypothetical protein E3C22_13105 [Jiella endophytica]|uniref:UrcA family protein n=1 Tax=Jiella endophytica TaxID=2558362 RepID=A0A4Y8RFZ5_9HYPH|nr:hypothetical protein [Jiella endophytica]TFF21629.1 hypothetical protein E3C22_13105 [Jiella endophytica]
MASQLDGKTRATGSWMAAMLALAALTGPVAAQTVGSVAEDPIEADPATALVEVSLGDWEVKNSIASKLSRKLSDIPLTVRVKPDIANDVCPLGRSDLDQQVAISPTRTCAAKKTSEALEAEVRKVIPTP